MKIITILAALLLTIPAVQAQKKEIKKAEKAVNSGDLSSAYSYLQQAKRIFAAADNNTRALYYIVEAEMNLANPQMDMNRMEAISSSLQRALKYDPDSSLVNRIGKVKSRLNNLSASAALGEYTKKNYSNAATLYNVAYQSTKDPDHCFNAARSHLLAKEFNEAFDMYTRLYQTGYTDAKVRYATTAGESNTKEVYTTETLDVYTGFTDVITSTASTRQVVAQKGTAKKQEKIVTHSKTPELLRGLTTAAIQVNKESAAVAIIDDALAKHPNDKILLNQVFHLYRQLGQTDKYNRIMDVLIAQTPNDPMLFYNFGVSSGQSGDVDRAKEFYKKTLALEPNHSNAKLNLTYLLLDEEAVITEEMNQLGMSAEDDKRYEQLKGKLNTLYFEVLPYLEHIVDSKPQNKDLVKKLMSIYGFIGQDTKMAILQEKIDD